MPFLSGVLTEKFFNGGVYSYVICDSCVSVEFVLPYMEKSSLKYRVEFFSSDRTTVVTKQAPANGVNSSRSYIAIDSLMIGQLMVDKKVPISLRDRGVYSDLTIFESFLLQYVVAHAAKNNLEGYFQGYNPASFVAWMKFKH